MKVPHGTILRLFIRPRRLLRLSCGFATLLLLLLFLMTAAAIASFGLGWSAEGLWVCVGRWGRRLRAGGRPDSPDQPLVLLRRDLSATLLRAANDVRWGRPASAVAELQSAAAMLDPRFGNEHLSLYPIPQNNWVPLQVWDDQEPTRPTADVSHQQQKEDEERQQFLVQQQRELKPLRRRQGIEYSNYDAPGPSDYDKEENLWQPLKDAAINFSMEGTADNLLTPMVAHLPIDLISEIDDRWTANVFTPIKMASLVTLLVDGCSVPLDVNEQVVTHLKMLWPSLDLRLAISKHMDAKYTQRLRNIAGVDVLSVVCQGSGGQIPPLVEGVTSPFVLLLESASAVTKDLSIRRLLATAGAVQGAAVIGMSERGKDGAWDYVCTQLDIRNTELHLRHGYIFSRAGCLFCDVTSSSFLAATWVLKDTVPDYTLPEPSRKLDWSLRLQRQGVLLMTCPDLMTHTNNVVQTAEPLVSLDKPCVTKNQRIEARDHHMSLKRQYRKLARKWELTSIVLDNNTHLEYSCLEIHFNCQAVARVKYYVLPSCCLKIKHKMFETLDAIAKKIKVPYEVNSGSLLGAVKFKDAIPWDFDDDAVYKNSDMGKFKKYKQKMRQLGLSPVYKKEVSKNKSSLHNYVSMTGQGGFSMDLWGVDEFPSHAEYQRLKEVPNNLVCFRNDHTPVQITALIAEYESHKRKPFQLLQSKRVESNAISDHTEGTTSDGKPVGVRVLSRQPSPPHCNLLSLVRIGSNWLPGPWNPGQSARKKYGPRLFQHEPHWRMKIPQQRGWGKCPRPGHHSCLDLHPLDGSIPFL